MIIKNNDERLHIIGSISLLPGCNDVDREEWDKLTGVKEFPAPKGAGTIKYALYDVEDLLSSKKLEILKDEGNIKDFSNFPAERRKMIINDTYNIKTLEEWVMREEDVSLKYIMEKRIDGIKKAEIKDVEKYGKPKNHV